jgi:hypothetical protein
MACLQVDGALSTDSRAERDEGKRYRPAMKGLSSSERQQIQNGRLSELYVFGDRLKVFCC